MNIFLRKLLKNIINKKESIYNNQRLIKMNHIKILMKKDKKFHNIRRKFGFDMKRLKNLN